MEDKQFKEALFFLSKKKIHNGKSLDDIFRIDGTPLWWFYKRMVSRSHIPIGYSYNEMVKKVKENKKPSAFWNIYQQIKLFFLLKMFASNEYCKIFFSGGKKQYKRVKKGKRAIFLTYTAHISHGQVYRLQHILDVIQKETNIEEKILVTSPLSEPFSLSPPKYSSLYQYIDNSLKNKCKKKAKKIANEWKRIVPAVHKSMEEQLWNVVSIKLQFVFSKEFLYYTLLYYETLKKLFIEEKPDVCIITAAVGLVEECLIVAAQSQKIPVLLIQHGQGVGFQNTDFDRFQNVHFAVYGEPEKKTLTASGISAKNIHITGSTLFEDLQKKKGKRRKELKHITIITQPFVEEKIWSKKQKKLFLLSLKKIMEKLPNKTVTIKIHPIEDKRVYKKFFRNLSNCRIVDEKLCEVLSKTDIVIGNYSTALIEAMVLDKPLMIFDPLKYLTTPPTSIYLTELQKGIFSDIIAKKNIEEGYVPYFSDIHQLIDNIEKFFDSPNLEKHLKERRKFLNKHIKIEGSAAKEIVEIITHLAE